MKDRNSVLYAPSYRDPSGREAPDLANIRLTAKECRDESEGAPFKLCVTWKPRARTKRRAHAANR